jgi:hypothetical protein
MHDSIDQLIDEIAAMHQALSKRGAGVPIGQYCSDPAAAWAAESVVRGQVLPVNQATAIALAGAATALRTVRPGTDETAI